MTVYDVGVLLLPTFCSDGHTLMDAWVPYGVREHCRDAVRIWAELEGKSPQMTEDLVRTSAQPAAKRLGASVVIVAALRLSAWALETWWHFTRR